MQLKFHSLNTWIVEVQRLSGSNEEERTRERASERKGEFCIKLKMANKKNQIQLSMEMVLDQDQNRPEAPIYCTKTALHVFRCVHPIHTIPLKCINGIKLKIGLP